MESTATGLRGIVACLLLGCACLAAEEGPATKASESAKVAGAEGSAIAPSPLEELRPEIYLKDKQGALVLLPGFQLSDLDEVYRWKQKMGRPDQRPRYSLQKLSISGAAGAGQAELTVQLTVVVRENDWVRVPLRLDQALLLEPPQYKGAGQQFLHFEPGGDGYVSWIRTSAEQPNELTLRMLVPVSQIGEETRLKLCVPRATTSELRLKVPLAGAVAKASEGATLLTPAGPHGSTTELTAVGMSGDFELAWHKPGGQGAELPMVLEATAAILARVDSRSLNAEATLSVRSHGAPFDRFRVRLPPGAELTPGGPSDYSAVPLEQADAGSPDQRVVEVQLPKRTVAAEVRLMTQRMRDVMRPAEWSELAGFEVVGAARQWGQIAVAVADDCQVLWGPSRGVRQIDQLAEPLRQPDVTAGFEFFAQPFSLNARLMPRKTRIHLDPEYLLLVDANRVRLDAKLKYTVRGARVFALDVALGDWQLEEVGPENVVAIDGVQVEEGRQLSIPLAQPAMGQIELRLRAHRSIPP